MRRAKLTNSLNKGVLDEDLIDRVDLSHYHAGMRVGVNVEPVPQSGFRRRAGTALAAPYRLRNRLEPVALTAAMLTVHNGGVKENLIDQDGATLFVTTSVAAVPFVVIEVQLPIFVTVTAVDLERFYCERTGIDNHLAVEYWTGTTWLPFGVPAQADIGPYRDLRTTARTRRFALPPGISVAMQSIRVVLYGGDGIAPDGVGQVTLAGISLWRERTDKSRNVRLIEFARDAEASYVAAITDRNIDLYDGADYIGSLPLQMPDWRIGELNWQQSLDTLFLYHEDMHTPQFTRQGARDEWNAEPVTFTNVPTLKPSQTFSGSTDEVQDIVTTMVSGDYAVAIVGTLKTPAVPFTSLAAFATALAGALNALPGIEVEIAVVSSSPQRLRLSYKGAAANRAWPLIDVIVLQPATSTATTSSVKRGLNASGPIVGAATGWPRCGVLYQARHWLGGFRSAPQTIVASVVGDYLNLQSGTTADKSIALTLDTNQVETVRDIVAGRHLQVFTERGEWWSDNRTFDATQPVNFILATRYGASPSVPPVFGDGATIFAQTGGSVIRDMQYVDGAQNYESSVLSLLSAKIATNIVDMAYRPAIVASDAGRLYCVRADGKVAHLSLNKGQEIVAWSLHDYTDPIRAVLVTSKSDVFFAIETAGGLWLLRRDEAALTDATVYRTTTPTTFVGALGYHEGRVVWSIADQEIAGPHTVVAGGLQLPFPAATVATGRDFLVDAEPMPLRDKITEAQPFRPPARIYALDVSVKASGVFELATNQDEFQEIDARYYDVGPSDEDAIGGETAAPPDAPMMERLVTGIVRVDGCEGITHHPRWRIRQRKPAPLHVRAVRLELAMQG